MVFFAVKDFWEKIVKRRQFKKADKKTADSSSNITLKKPFIKPRNDFYNRIIKNLHPDKQVEKPGQKSRGEKG